MQERKDANEMSCMDIVLLIAYLAISAPILMVGIAWKAWREPGLKPPAQPRPKKRMGHGPSNLFDP